MIVCKTKTEARCLAAYLRTLNPEPQRSGAPWLLFVILAAFLMGAVAI